MDSNTVELWYILLYTLNVLWQTSVFFF